jgi:hypothetical protein
MDGLLAMLREMRDLMPKCHQGAHMLHGPSMRTMHKMLALIW